jgi:very-short-patch-repair endonuclease
MPPFRTRLARYLRQTMSPAQSQLWERLRMRQVGGWKFRRQHPIGPYFVDFYCPAARLVVQIVSATHEDGPSMHDHARRLALAAGGYRVVEVSAAHVEADIDSVVDVIDRAMHALGASANRRSRRGDRPPYNSPLREPDESQSNGGRKRLDQHDPSIYGRASVQAGDDDAGQEKRQDRPP